MSVAVAWAAHSVYVIANLYLLVLLVRVGLDWARFFARSWRPSGAALVLANAVYTLSGGRTGTPRHGGDVCC